MTSAVAGGGSSSKFTHAIISRVPDVYARQHSTANGRVRIMEEKHHSHNWSFPLLLG